MQRCAQQVDGEVDDAYHDEDEDGNGRPFASEDFVNLAAAAVFFALFGFDYGSVTELLDEGEAHLCHGSSTVEAAFLFHLHDEVLQSLFLGLREFQSFHDDRVAFHQLGGGKADGDVGTLGMVLDEVHDAVQTTVYGAAMVVLVAEVLTNGCFLILRDVDGVVDQLVDTFVFRSGDGHHGQTEYQLHLIHHDAAAIVAHLIHHIECQYHRHPQLHQLHGQVEIALDIVGIHNVDDGLGLLLHDELARDNLLRSIRREGVDAWQVGD